MPVFWWLWIYIFYEIIVEREGFAFNLEVVYEGLPVFFFTL